MSFDRISKSQYLRGLQCPKALWYYRHRPDLMPEAPDSRQALFDAGHEVGHLAQQYFTGGVEITEPFHAVDQAIATTQTAVAGGVAVLYEATAVSPDGAFSRIDILKKAPGGDRWDLIEVKMATGVKDYHLDDMALQRYAFTGAGYNIRKSILMHINGRYVRSGGLNLQSLFTLENCTAEVKARMADVGEKVAALIQVINQDQEPAVAPGDHCYTPFECDYTGHCLPPVPDDSICHFFPAGAKLKTLLDQNITRISDIPDDLAMTTRQRIAVDAARTGRIYKDLKKIKAFLKTLTYPLYFLDYETVAPVVPLFNRTRPFQQIPFQFSLHIQHKKGGPLTHVEFLHTEKTDPRPELIRKLVSHCGNKGSVLVYNQAFESRITDELGQAFAYFRPALSKIRGRMVDLLIPFRSRHLYHPDMKCSASLKSVLPAFVPDMSYDNLEIGDGGAAAHLYLNCLKDAIPAEEQQKIFDNLRLYCGQDTLAEVRLLEVMDGFV